MFHFHAVFGLFVWFFIFIFYLFLVVVVVDDDDDDDKMPPLYVGLVAVCHWII